LNQNDQWQEHAALQSAAFILGKAQEYKFNIGKTVWNESVSFTDRRKMEPICGREEPFTSETKPFQ
jgi:hypothetical protein